MSNIYCVKCKERTPTVGMRIVSYRGKGGEARKKEVGKCKICGTNKTRFLKSSGGRISLPGGRISLPAGRISLPGGRVRLPGGMITRTPGGTQDEALRILNALKHVGKQTIRGTKQTAQRVGQWFEDNPYGLVGKAFGMNPKKQ